MDLPPRPEYPRPQLRRSRWLNLNGEWRFAFDDADRGSSQGWQCVSASHLQAGRSPFQRHITVPFCFQAPLSGIGESAFHDVVWYARTFPIPSWDADHERLLLHFGAVDYHATVWVNGIQVADHEGGHTPFSADITHALSGDDNVVVLRAVDPSQDKTIPRGKQFWEERPESIFYMRTTGIWQTVWLEPVDRSHIRELRLTPDPDAGTITVEIGVAGFESGLAARLLVAREGTVVLTDDVALTSTWTERSLFLGAGMGADQQVDLWSPEQPNLYDCTIELLRDGDRAIDTVETYFGMRKIEARDGRVYLNGRPYYQRLVLDQGYFPGGLLTAPSDDDLRGDIEMAKKMGFNGARKHQKVEDPRWLYWADRLGFLVWGEMANAFEYSPDYVRRITAEWQEVLRRDYNHPCIVVWVPINESSGGRRLARDALRVEHLLAMYHLTRSLDTSRLVVSNDGWELVTSDLCTIHDYGDADALARRYRARESSLVNPDPAGPDVYYSGHGHRGEPILITEFGGIMLDRGDGKGWGYRKAANADEFLAQYYDLIAALRQSDVIDGFCYTQLTDVAQETNGLLTENREPKADIDAIRAITRLGC